MLWKRCVCEILNDLVVSFIVEAIAIFLSYDFIFLF